ncbi:MAG: potassium/proton antiporter [Miltoncostaeaceae bacterium]
MLGAGALLVLGVIAALTATRAGLPVLVAFLGVGMLLGSEGVGGIAFDDTELAQFVGIVGLVAILWEGGLTTAWRDVRGVLASSALLATVGVVVTAAIVGGAAYMLFDLTLVEAMLLGAVVGSTDAAAVFATLRFTTLRRRVAGLLEAESGLNDPMAVALTVGLIAMATGDGTGPAGVAGGVVWSLGVGLVAGLVLGEVAVRAVTRLPASFGPFAPVLSVGMACIAFGLPEAAGGSGFLAVYLVALRLGNTPNPFRRALAAFHGGLAFIAQVSLFIVLGLLVFPSDLVDIAIPGLVLAAVLILVARPVAVWLCTVRPAMTGRERVVLSWAGLRGAVPIVLGTFVLSEGVGAGSTIFNAVFFVVLVSTAVQGPLLEPLARRLGLVDERAAVYEPPIEIGAVGGADILEFAVREGYSAAGALVRDLGLPRTALLAVVLRDGQAVPPRGRTRIEAGDRLYVLTRTNDLDEVSAVLDGWREATGPEPPPAGGGIAPGG